MPVRQAWISAVAALGGDAIRAEPGAYELEIRYAESHRRYHRTSHVEAVLALSAQLAVNEAFDSAERALLDLAVCAHDVVYDTRPGDDERASAEWARTHLTAAGVDKASVARVEALVMTTWTAPSCACGRAPSRRSRRPWSNGSATAASGRGPSG